VGPAFAAAYVAGYVAVFAPAGLGIREVSLVAFLAPVLAPEPAAALAVVARLWTTGVELLPAALLALWHLKRDPFTGAPAGEGGSPEPVPDATRAGSPTDDDSGERGGA
jgi:hypothetical protein